MHYNTDEEVTTKYTTGYSKTEKESMEKSVGGKAGGGILGFKVEVSASMKLTTDYTENWHEESSIEVKKKFEAHHTYCTWRLNDAVELAVETMTTTTTAGVPPVITSTPSQDRIINVISIYGDEAKDDVAPENNYALFSRNKILFLNNLTLSAKTKTDTKATIELISVSSPNSGQYEATFEVTTPGCSASACGHFEATFVMEDETTETINVEGWSTAESLKGQPFRIHAMVTLEQAPR